MGVRTRIAGTLLMAMLLGCSNEPEERVLVPFDDWRGGHEIRVPAVGFARGCPDSDGQIVGIACFDPPIHPEGHIHWLSIGGHDVPLADTRLEEGMLQTRDFGAVEIIMPRTNRTEMLATPSQIRAIETWIAAQDENTEGRR